MVRFQQFLDGSYTLSVKDKKGPLLEIKKTKKKFKKKYYSSSDVRRPQKTFSVEKTKELGKIEIYIESKIFFVFAQPNSNF